MTTRRSALLLLALAGCADPKGPGTGADTAVADTSPTTGEPTTSTPTTGTTGATEDGGTTDFTAPCDDPRASTDSCCCFSLSEEVDGYAVANACPSPSLCPRVEIQCNDDPFAASCPPTTASITVESAADLECALTALRDGTPGELTWSYNAGGYANHEETLHILPDREAFNYWREQIDLGSEASDAVRGALRPADDYAACLAADSVAARTACLHEALVGALLAVCVEGGSF